MGWLQQQVLPALAPHVRLVTSAVYLAAFVCVCIFPSFDRKTEVEEHGLIGHGYANSGINGPWPKRVRTLVESFDQLQSREEVLPALGAALKESELPVYRMNFTTPAGDRSALMYTIAPSMQGDSREALVVVCAANWTAGKHKLAHVSWTLASGVALAQYLKTVSWLSRDVLVVFVDGSLPYGAGARAWLSAYFGGTSAVRRGVLRQAVVLDIGYRPSSYLMDVEGINGMVPNQDLVNTFVDYAEKFRLPVYHRPAWESVFHTLTNGGVHSAHGAFLELQVPAFTVKGRMTKGDRQSKDVEPLVRSLEGLMRSLSYNLQQLHHSFNFYFFTGLNSHISSGLYLYPVFGMQLPLIAFLMTTPAYRDIRSFLVGLGSVVAVIAAAGGPIFVLASNEKLTASLAAVMPGVDLQQVVPPSCGTSGMDQTGAARSTAALWLLAGFIGAACAAWFLRRFAFSVFKASIEGEASLKSGTVFGDKGVQLPSPLWDAVRCSSGFAFLVVLAPITIYSWALAVPLTAVSVPMLVLARPFSFTRRPLRSFVLLVFLLGNVFLLVVPPAQRIEMLAGVPGIATQRLYDAFDQSVVPAVPFQARKYLPMPLMAWLRGGQLSSALEGDALIALYRAARDFNCAGGMLFPVFCFVYFPMLVLLGIVGIVLPAQRVDDAGMTVQQFRLLVLLLLLLIGGSIAGGVVWRSMSSSGLGTLQW